MCSRPLRPLGLPIYVARLPAAPSKLVRFPARSSITLATLPSTSLIRQPRSLTPTLAHCFPRNFTFYVALPFALLIGLEKRAKIGFMGHNKGRDNARKRAKRQKKHERLARAKKKQPKK